MRSVKTVTSYIASFPKAVQQKLRLVQKIIATEAPKAKQVIKYGIPTFVLDKNLIHFAAFKNHLGLYPGPRAITHFKKELEEYRTTKGAIQIPIDKPVPVALIKRITKFRIQEIKKKEIN